MTETPPAQPDLPEPPEEIGGYRPASEIPARVAVLGRPGAVLAAAWILGFGSVVGLCIYGFAFVGIAVSEGEFTVYTAYFALGVMLCLLELMAIVFVLRGRGWARGLLVACAAVGVATSALSGSLSFGTALVVLAIVLLFLPKSSEWFRSKR